MKLVSFIVLCYNQEFLIKRAILSIINANIPKEDYEIIIIDDGSIDYSVDVINDYVNKYDNIKLLFTDVNHINTKNQSLGRNIGVKNAIGKYIRFLDGDDYFNSVDLGKEYKEISELNENYNVIFSNRVNLYDNHRDAKIINGYCYSGISNYYANRQFLIDYNIWHDEEIFTYYSEDCYFFAKMLVKISSYYILTKSIFTYICNKIMTHRTNTTLSKLMIEEYYLDFVHTQDKLISALKEINCTCDDLFKKSILEYMIKEEVDTVTGVSANYIMYGGGV